MNASKLFQNSHPLWIIAIYASQWCHWPRMNWVNYNANDTPYFRFIFLCMAYNMIALNLRSVLDFIFWFHFSCFINTHNIVDIVNISDFISFRQFSWQDLVILLDFLQFTLIISRQVFIASRVGFPFEFHIFQQSGAKQKSTLWQLLMYIMNEAYFELSSQCHTNLIITLPIANSALTTKRLEYDLAWYC